MICTADKGGMRAVVEGYRQSGLFDRWNVEWLRPHDKGSMAFRLRLALASYLRCLSLLLSRQVSMVHAHASMRGSFWRKAAFAITARALNVPVVFHLHGSETDKFINAQPALLKKLIAWILGNVSMVVVLSESWRNYIQGVSSAARVVVVPNYVQIPADRYADPLQSDTTVSFLFLGAVGIRKGVYPMLEAFALALARSTKPLHLVIGGDGELDKAKTLCKQLGIENFVTFAGWVNGDAKTHLLRHASVYILPSFHEGLPVSILEAMSYRLPIISTKVGGIPELVRNGLDGWLVDAGDVEQLALRIAELANSADLRKQMGNSAYERVCAGYSDHAIVPRIEAIYSELAKS